MDEKTVRALGAINRDFYRNSATAFSETRRNSWPGWKPLAVWIEGRLPDRALRVLDVGCGNGRFGAFLADALPERASEIDYCGLDASAPLLDSVRARRLPVAAAEVVLGDLIETPLDSLLADRAFSLIAVFGLLHHIPSERKRTDLLVSLARRLEPGGLLALAFWRFDDFERFRVRRKAFEEWNRDAPEAIDLSQLEPGDTLLRWGEGPDAVRYCHHVDDAEAERLLEAAGLEQLACYDADGREGSLNRYFVLVARGGE
ncbi:MAG: class I SAM-dependent methyltransferase [Deltaproteobacteria bacterium]|nr:class I SAM-dependent methyltransferase [Deltaproteobacteria bacterium]MBW2667285.1 class I SAM-dependent methyltransferase [Deltaproteobacteria bacterium]